MPLGNQSASGKIAKMHFVLTVTRRFGAYSASIYVALAYHKRTRACIGQHNQSRYDVCDTGDFIDTFHTFRYEDVPLNSMEPTLDSLFAVDASNLAGTNLPIDDSSDEKRSENTEQPEMFMRRATREVAKQLYAASAVIGKYKFQNL